MSTVTWPSAQAEGRRRRPGRRPASTRCTSMKWLPAPSVPSCPAPRSWARAETAAGSAPGRQPCDSVRSRSSSRPMPRSTSARGPSRSTRVELAAARASAARACPVPAGIAREISCTSGSRRSPSSAAEQRQDEQPHAAVDVVADPARRDDAVRELHRRDAADREAVALVDVRHRERRVDDPRQRGDVLELLERAVARIASSSSSSAKTRAGTRMSGRASAGISHSTSLTCRSAKLSPVGSITSRRASGRASRVLGAAPA